MDKDIKDKKGLELMTSRSSGYKTSSKQFLFLVMYYLTSSDDFLFISKIFKFMEPNS